MEGLNMAFRTQKRNFFVDKAIEWEQEGKLLHYVFSPETVEGGKLLDISGNDKDGTQVGTPTLCPDGLVYDGVKDYEDTGITQSFSVCTLAMRLSDLEYNVAARHILSNNGADRVYIQTDGIVNLTLTGTPKVSINPIFTDQLESDYVFVVNLPDVSIYKNGQFIEIVSEVTWTGLVPRLLFGKDFVSGVTFLGCTAHDVQFWNVAWTQQQVKDYHNSFRQPSLLDSFEDSPLGATITPEWCDISGSGKIVKPDVQVLGSNVGVFDGSTSIELTNNPIVGTGDFEVNVIFKPTNIASVGVLCGHSATGQFTIRLNADGRVGLIHSGVSSFFTSVATVNESEINTINYKQQGTSGVLTVNGVEEVVAYNGDYSGDGYFIGSRATINYFIGSIYELTINNKSIIRSNYKFSTGAGNLELDTVPEHLGNNVTEGDQAADYNVNQGVATDNPDGSITVTCSAINSVGLRKIVTIGIEFEITFIAKSNIIQPSGFLTIGDNVTNARDTNPTLSTEFQEYRFRRVSTSANGRMYANLTNIGDTIVYDNIAWNIVLKPADGVITTSNIDVFWGKDTDSELDNTVDGYSQGIVGRVVGNAWIYSTVAYGIYDFIINRGTSVALLVQVIGQNKNTNFSQDRYTVWVNTSNQIAILKGGGILLSSANNYINININIRVILFRNEFVDQYVTGGIGTFAIFLQGRDGYPITSTVYNEVVLSEMELVDVTGGSGTNPVTDNDFTTTNTIVTSLPSSQSISNLRVNGKYIPLHNFSNETGTYNKLFIPAQSGNTGLDVNNQVLQVPPSVVLDSTKSWRQLVAGPRFTPSTQAYAEWVIEDVKRSMYTGFLDTYIINNVGRSEFTDGYCVRMSSSGRVELFRTVIAGYASWGPLFRSSTSFYELSIAYDIKVVRLQSPGIIPDIDYVTIHPANTFALFIKGGTFGRDQWTLVPAASGSNPVVDGTHTESYYLGTDMDANDEIGGVQLFNQIQI